MKGQSKTAKTPTQYIAELAEPRRGDIQRLHGLIRKAAPALKPHVQAGMLAYGPIKYRYASGREGEWFKLGVASNARYISLYACAADERGYVAERYRQKLPGANIGKSCVRFRKLDDLDQRALTALIKETARGKWGT